MKNNMLNKVSNTMNKVTFSCKKHSPEILIGLGIVGTVASTVMACKATTKLSTITEETKEAAQAVHEALDRELEGYSVEDSKKDLTIIYTQAAVKVAKIYAPAVILGTLSLTSIVASNNILRKRNVALAAAYAAVDKSFKEYRGRVVERFGSEVDYELTHNIKAVEITETVVDAKGKEKEVTKTVKVADPNTTSLYSTYFDETTSVYANQNWDYNMTLLKAQQNVCNQLLQSKGIVTLNEVYSAIGMEETKAGMVVGWLYSKDEEKATGDNYIDFGIGDTYIDNKEGGCKRVITLDFNVDGNIYTKL